MIFCIILCSLTKFCPGHLRNWKKYHCLQVFACAGTEHHLVLWKAINFYLRRNEAFCYRALFKRNIPLVSKSLCQFLFPVVGSHCHFLLGAHPPTLYFVQYFLCSVCPSFWCLVWPVLRFLSKHAVSFFLWFSLCLFQLHLSSEMSVAAIACTGRWKFCVLALKFTISTGSISSGVPQDCRFSGCLTLMNCHLSSD